MCKQEVNQHTVGLHFRLIVRIKTFGVQDEADVWVVFSLLIANLDVSAIRIWGFNI